MPSNTERVRPTANRRQANVNKRKTNNTRKVANNTKKVNNRPAAVPATIKRTTTFRRCR